MTAAENLDTTQGINPIPERMQGFIPYLVVPNAKEAIQFYSKAFSGKVLLELNMKDGTLGHGEVLVGNTRIMLSEEKAEWNMKGPKAIGGCPVTLTIYVDDVDNFAKGMVAAGMKMTREVQDHFYGDRMGTFEDPYGYIWCIGSRIEEIPGAEMQKRMNELFEEN